jgi:hypothetical protein
MKDIFTRLSDELSTTDLDDFNDVPLTQEDLDDLYYADWEAERKELEDRQVISRVLEKVGINLYEQEYKSYC